MPQPLFQAEQDGRLIAGLGVDDAIGMQAGAGERRGEQAARAQAPQDRARHAGEDTSGEQHRGGAMNGANVAASYFVERAARQASLRQARVDLADAERHDAAISAARMFDAGDPGAQIVEDAFVRVRHVPPNGG
jgi:hypothetical protein